MLCGLDERSEMLEIDGSEQSGSGTIVRDAVPFCILIGQEIHLKNIRAKRDKPGPAARRPGLVRPGPRPDGPHGPQARRLSPLINSEG